MILTEIIIPPEPCFLFVLRKSCVARLLIEPAVSNCCHVKLQVGNYQRTTRGAATSAQMQLSSSSYSGSAACRPAASDPPGSGRLRLRLLSQVLKTLATRRRRARITPLALWSKQTRKPSILKARTPGFSHPRKLRYAARVGCCPRVAFIFEPVATVPPAVWRHHPIMQQSGEPAVEYERPLREDWEAITDDSGRTYFWNTQTDEVTWNRIEATAPRDYAGPSLGGQGDPCTACGKMVFLAERRAAGSAPYHADCFRCKICAKKLLTDWEADPEGALFCQVHFNQQLMAKGMPSSRRSASATASAET